MGVGQAQYRGISSFILIFFSINANQFIGMIERYLR